MMVPMAPKTAVLPGFFDVDPPSWGIAVVVMRIAKVKATETKSTRILVESVDGALLFVGG